MPVDGNGDSVKVNIAEVYRVLLELRDEVKATNARLETHATLTLHPNGQAVVADHEARLRVAENALTPLAREAEARSISVRQEIRTLETKVGHLEDKLSALNARMAWFAGGLATLVTVLNLLPKFISA